MDDGQLSRRKALAAGGIAVAGTAAAAGTVYTLFTGFMTADPTVQASGDISHTIEYTTTNGEVADVRIWMDDVHIEWSGLPADASGAWARIYAEDEDGDMQRVHGYDGWPFNGNMTPEGSHTLEFPHNYQYNEVLLEHSDTLIGDGHYSEGYFDVSEPDSTETFEIPVEVAVTLFDVDGGEYEDREAGTVTLEVHYEADPDVSVTEPTVDGRVYDHEDDG